jgi:hypothetical protein
MFIAANTRPNKTRINVAAISTYTGQFFSGGVDSSMPHLVLILLAVIGGLAVGGGIIWEASRSGHLWTLPTAFVFFGVVIEAAATVILFEFDEGISRNQQSIIDVQQTVIRSQNDKIIALDTQLNGFLTPRKLTKVHKDRRAEVTKRFSSMTFVGMIESEEEPWEFLIEIGNTLKENGCDWKPFPGGIGPLNGETPAVGETITDRIVIGAPLDLKDGAEKLASALTDPGVIGMERTTTLIKPEYNVLVIIVGSKR